MGPLLDAFLGLAAESRHCDCGAGPQHLYAACTRPARIKDAVSTLVQCRHFHAIGVPTTALDLVAAHVVVATLLMRPGRTVSFHCAQRHECNAFVVGVSDLLIAHASANGADYAVTVPHVSDGAPTVVVFETQKDAPRSELRVVCGGVRDTPSDVVVTSGFTLVESLAIVGDAASCIVFAPAWPTEPTEVKCGKLPPFVIDCAPAAKTTTSAHCKACGAEV